MSFRNISILIVVASMMALTAAPGAAACADPHCPWSPVTMCVPNVPDCIENTADTVRAIGKFVSDTVCEVLC